MASRFFGINLGQTEVNVVEGASTNSTDVEVQVNLATVTTQQQVLNMLDYISQFFLRETTKYPPH